MMNDQEQLPPGWAYCTIGDVIARNGIFTDGDWVESKDQDPDGDVRLIQLADVGDGKFLNKSARYLTRSKAHQLNCTFLKTGDLLVARMPDPLGRCCIFPLDGHEQFVTVVDVCAIRPGTSLVDRRYMMYLINCPQVRTQIARLQSGSTRKRISRTNLGTIPLPLAPFKEQSRIVSKIEELFSELDKGVENLETARQQLKVYRQAVLKHAFEGKFTEQWREENRDRLNTPEQVMACIETERERHYQQQLARWKSALNQWQRKNRKGTRPAKPRAPRPLSLAPAEELELLPLPVGWAYVRLGSVIDEPTYGTSKRCNYDINGIGVLRIPNVVNGVIDSTDLKFANFDDEEMEAYRLRDRDILTIRSNGSLSLVGRSALVKQADEHYLYAGYLIRLRPNQVLVNPRYLLEVLSTHFLRSQVQGKAKSTSGVNNINAGEIQDLIIPYCSLLEQENLIGRLAEILSSIDATEAEIKKQLRRSETLRQSILKEAFSGRLVPQDPHDEPASILLERIKAEKARAVSPSANGTRNSRRTNTRKRSTVA